MPFVCPDHSCSIRGSIIFAPKETDMKKIILPFIIFTGLAFTACKNKSGPAADPKQQEADTLEKQVLKDHDIAMPKAMRLPKLKKEIQRQLDSIGTLPARAQEAAASFKSKLETLLNELDYADFAMDKWMVEFNIDSAKDNIEQRIKYLTDEKIKVSKVKDAVLTGLAKADSLLKAKL
jgi:hypothetical protein